MIEGLHSVSLFRGDLGGEPDRLVCPHCGSESVRGDLHEKHVTDDYTCPLGTRGSWLSLLFECENCTTKWRLVIGFHKGQTKIGIVA